MLLLPLSLKRVHLAITIVVISVVEDVEGPHVCNHLGIQAFCFVSNHFASIYKTTVPQPYPQFAEIVNILPTIQFPIENPVPSSPLTSISTYNRYCELEYVKGDFPKGIPGSPGSCGKSHQKNPYSLEVTEIEVNGQRMHNWLHITIKSDPEKRNKLKQLCGGDVTGKIKYAFLVVVDESSWAVGDFDHDMPCGHDCKCKLPNCYQASKKDSIPCMYVNKTVATQPGQLMMYSEKGVEEIHATWKFAQYQHKSTFRTELHFFALLLEDLTEVNYESNSDDERSEPSSYRGPYGWNPKYDILWPTKKTLGGWDYFRRGVYKRSQIKCHIPRKEGDSYVTEPYPSMGTKTYTNISKSGQRHLKFGSPGQASPTALRGARFMDIASLSHQDPRLYFGYYRDTYPYPFAEQSYYKTLGWESKKDGSALWGGRHPNFPPNTPTPDVWDELDQLKKISSNVLFDVDKCACPKFATTPSPADVPPPPIQVQGRKSHAVQMIIDWLCIVHFGIFIARYYKETYSKVFFLQEFWWYSIHVLCLVLAAMFMLGGIYAIEINRKDPIRWGDPNILLHNAIGGVAIFLFLVHLCLGHQRLRDVQLRMLQIMLHWAIGFVEYILAITSMLLSAFVLQGCLPCYAFYVICGFVGVQLIFYILMEVHMRQVDKLLKLNPPRRYLPPPVMRVFLFRVYMLVFYGTICTCVYASVHVLIKYNDKGESCFKTQPVIANATLNSTTAKP